MPVTNDELTSHVESMANVLHGKGITPLYLARKLKAELNAKEVKVFNDKEDGIVYSKALPAWNIRQKARMDAHKLMNHYPAEKHEHTGKDGAPIESRMTFFPPEPETVEEWLEMKAEIDKRMAAEKETQSE
jgi:hypothetical protein